MSTLPDKPNRLESLNNELIGRIAAHRSNYWFGFFTDPLTAFFLLAWDLFVLKGKPAFIAVGYMTGLLSWTLFEYCFHRWIYHHGSTLAHAGHKLHHESPKALIGMPWFLTSGFLLINWFLFGKWFSIPYVLSGLAGLTTGFFFYGVFHHVHHHANPKKSWNRKLRAHHQIHHKLPQFNFGVTNRFWDHVFGTAFAPRREKRRRAQ